METLEKITLPFNLSPCIITFNMEQEETFGPYLRNLRKRLDLTQEEVAKAVGITKSYLSLIENDTSPSTDAPPRIGLEKLRAFARVLRVPEAEMIDRAKIAPDGYRLVKDAKDTQEALRLRQEMGQRVRARRELLRLSQEDVARPLGISREMVSNYETGKTPLSTEQIPHLAAALKTTASYIYGDEPAAGGELARKVDELRELLGRVAPEKNTPEPDVLGRIGPRVDVSAIEGIRLSPALASAGDGSFPSDASVPVDMVRDQLSELPEGTEAIRVTGDCMGPEYREADILFVRPADTAENGQEVIALLDDDTLCCKVYHSDGEVFLRPRNGEARIPAGRFKVRGVVEGLLRLKR